MRRYKHADLRIIFNQKRWDFRKIVNRVKIEAWRAFTTNIRDPWDALIKIVKSTMVGKIQSRTLCNLSGEFATNMVYTLHLLSKQFYPTPEPLLDMHEVIERYVEDSLVDVCVGPKITKCELRKAVREMSKNTAPGFDKITNNVVSMLCKQPRLEREYLQLYNLCLRHFTFPKVWKVAKIILIPKPADNLDSTKAFRPISLTSSFAKLFERIMLARLMHYLTLSNVMVENQHAYRKGRSTQTALYEVFNVAQYAMQRRGACVIVFLDISGAFDRTWHGGILYKLLEYDVPKYLVLWIKSFLTDRSAVFMEGGEIHTENLQQGCPQGGVLSPVLWNVLFNEMLALPVCVGRKQLDVLRIVGYADDAAIICKADTMMEMEWMINQQLETIHEWAVRNRVAFNPLKLASMVLCNKQAVPPAARLFYNGVPINNVQTYKYLGLHIDRRLHWNIHISNVVNKLALVTRSLWGLSKESWGVSLDIYRTLFHSIFMPVLTYGIAIWGWKATSKVVAAKFDKEIRKFALMATHCQKSTSNMYLFYLLRAQPFSQILRNEVAKVSVSQLQITNTKRSGVYENYERRRKTRIIPQCMDQHFYMLRKGLGNCKISIDFNDANQQYSAHPSTWVQNRVIIRDSINALIEGIDMQGWVIYTDASASSYSYGWGFVAYRYGISRGMYNGSLSECSIFMAEAYAMLQAIVYMNTIENLGRKEVIEVRSDAQGLLRKLERIVQEDNLLQRIQQQLSIAFHSGKNVVLRWVPGHKGIYGNEYADLLAKRGVDGKNVSFMPITIQDIQQIYKKKNVFGIANRWNDFQSSITKLFLPNMQSMNKFIASSPTVAVCQLVSGHTRLREFVSRVLGLVESPMCACGKEKETVVHYVFHCELYKQIREEIWPDFQSCFAYITKDWEKLKEFVRQTRRFEGRAVKNRADRGGRRIHAV